MDELNNDKDDEMLLGDETKAIFGCLIDENSIDSSEILHDNELEYEVKRDEDGHNGIITYRIVHLTDSDSKQLENTSANSSSIMSNVANKIKTNSNNIISSTPPSSVTKLGNISASPPQYYIISPGDYTTSNETAYALSPLSTHQNKITSYRSKSTPNNNNNNNNKGNSALSTIAAASGITTTANGKLRNDRHRETHNAVERRRRNKINGLINQLGTLISSADYTSDNNGSQNNSVIQSTTTEIQSKGVILSKAYELIQKLQEKNECLTECLKENPRMMNETRALEHQNRALRKENETLREILLKSGIDLMAMSNIGISSATRPTTKPTPPAATTATAPKLSTNQTTTTTKIQSTVQPPIQQQTVVTNLNAMHLQQLLTSSKTIVEKTNQIRESCIKNKQESTKGS